MSSLQTQTPAITLSDEDRGVFVMKVYQHVLGAVGVFVAIEALLFATGAAESIYNFFQGGKWFLMLGLFMAGQWFAANAASDLDNPGRQYAGLFGSAAVYALVFAPILHIVYRIQDSGSTVLAAAAVTAIGFAILTAIAFTTRKDLSFLRPIVMWGVGASALLIVASILFGWALGTWFPVGMVALMGAAILYQTQTIIRHFPANAYVAAAVQLFGSLMTMFYYILSIFASRD